ncbi:MAG: hypothetical protein JSS29_02795 [Proteobacteria bacterium]|nr:hypothetical protein [Pseudomonadota bacterium]
MSKDLKERKTPLAATVTNPRAGKPERRQAERRTRVLRALVYGSFRPRRRGPRRADERQVAQLDWHHPQWLAISMLIVLGSCTDALLTLILVQRGIATEANPLMAPLIGNSVLAFALVKVVLTAGGVVLLTQLARIRAFGWIPVGVFLYLVLAIYGVLLGYELNLLDML